MCIRDSCNRHYVEICNIVEGDVSAEVIATDFEGMVREGEVLAAQSPLQPHHYCKAAFEIIGVRVMAVWWSVGDSNP